MERHKDAEPPAAAAAEPQKPPVWDELPAAVREVLKLIEPGLSRREQYEAQMAAAWRRFEDEVREAKLLLETIPALSEAEAARLNAHGKLIAALPLEQLAALAAWLRWERVGREYEAHRRANIQEQRRMARERRQAGPPVTVSLAEALDRLHLLEDDLNTAAEGIDATKEALDELAADLWWSKRDLRSLRRHLRRVAGGER